MKWFSGCFTFLVLLVGFAFAVPYIKPYLEEEDILYWENLLGVNHSGFYDTDSSRSTSGVLCDSPVPEANYEQAWYDLSQGHDFTLRVSVSGQNLCESAKYRDDLEINEWKDDFDYWRQVYVSLIQFDHPKMKELFARFKKLRDEQNLDYAEFAEAIITFIQNIPYVLVLNKSAKEAIKDGEFYRVYIEDEKRPYIENIKHGIHSPIEFLHTQEGDCDTRTVLAYAILSYFEYDVAIINTADHSMIGINIPGNGTSITYHGKKYYLWEITQPGWTLGMISPEHQQNLHVCVPSLHEHE